MNTEIYAICKMQILNPSSIKVVVVESKHWDKAEYRYEESSLRAPRFLDLIKNFFFSFTPVAASSWIVKNLKNQVL